MTKKTKKTKKKDKKRIVVSKSVKITEYTAELSGVIPTAAFENLKPSFGMKVQPIRRNIKPAKIFDYMEGILHSRFQLVENRARTDLIEKQYSYIRFRGKNGKKYPSVTSILYWDTLWRIPDDELNQYAARGKIVDKLLERYFETGKWENPLKMPEVKEEVSVLLGGSKGFHWEDCTHKRFITSYKNKINIKKQKVVIFNDEHLYSGEIDAIGDYDDVYSVMDFKTGTYDMRQLAAYAVCEKGIKQLVVLPVGPTDNKSGYMRPVICDTINEKFKEFLKARAKFKQRFGV